MELLQVQGLTVCARTAAGEAELVRDLSFTAGAGRRLAIVGESGCGKSMTALAILGLLPRGCAAWGQLLLDGRELSALSPRAMNALRGRELVLIPQSGADFLNPTLTVDSQMTETLRRMGIRGRETIGTRSRELLGAVGFDEPDSVLAKYPFQLSGGMAQRVVMAMGMAGAARLVIADEPTRGVDDETAAAFMDGITASFPGAAIVIITHSIAVARSCEDLLVMRGGRALEQGDTAAILQNPANAYTRSLIDALPENGLQVTGHPCGREGVHHG